MALFKALLNASVYNLLPLPVSHHALPLTCIEQDHFAKYEPTILELKRKYETAMKEKMLVSLERDKLAARMDSDAQLNRCVQRLAVQ